MKNKKIGIIILIVLLVIIVSAIVGYFGYKYIQSQETVGTTWGDKYLDKIQKDIEEGKYKNVENSKLEFLKIEETEEPILIVEYEENDRKITNIMTINDQNEVKKIAYKSNENAQDDIKYLYDLEKQEYGWYLWEKQENGDESYNHITKELVVQNFNVSENTLSYFQKDQLEKKENGKNYFDEKFVETDLELDKTDIDLQSKNGLKDTFKEKISKYEEESKKIEIAKETTNKKVEEIKSQEAKEAEEKTRQEQEKAKKDEEDRKRAEEAAKKAAEEATKGIKIGNYTIKYGNYVGDAGATGETLTINSDGTVTLKSSSGTEKYTYKIENYNFAQDSSSNNNKKAIVLYNTDGTKCFGLQAFSNTELGDGGTLQYNYKN